MIWYTVIRSDRVTLLVEMVLAELVKVPDPGKMVIELIVFIC